VLEGVVVVARRSELCQFIWSKGAKIEYVEIIVTVSTMLSPPPLVVETSVVMGSV
jgi:hypothetical protein